MRISYDPQVDAAYIYLREMSRLVEVEDYLGEQGIAAKTYACDPRKVEGMINLDFDKDGRLIGIEVLDASRKLRPDLLERLAGNPWIDL